MIALLCSPLFAFPSFDPPGSRFFKMFEKVGLTGFEPVTLRLSSACSNQLSYRPD
jgi:hypothetical protein